MSEEQGGGSGSSTSTISNPGVEKAIKDAISSTFSELLAYLSSVIDPDFLILGAIFPTSKKRLSTLSQNGLRRVSQSSRLRETKLSTSINSA